MECPHNCPATALACQIDFQFAAGGLVDNQHVMSTGERLLRVAGRDGNKKLIASNCEVDQVFLPGDRFHEQEHGLVRTRSSKAESWFPTVS